MLLGSLLLYLMRKREKSQRFQVIDKWIASSLLQHMLKSRAENRRHYENKD